MICKCLNPDGSLSPTCFGTCKMSSIIDYEIQQKNDPLNGFAELILSQVDKMIDAKLSKIKFEYENKANISSIEMFKEGFSQGYQIGFEKGDGY